MDTLEYIPEIRKCIQNSSSTLSKLKLSFSESLARQARKPPPADDTGDDSDQEIDQFGNIIPPPPPAVIASSDDGAPAKALLAQEEKKAQEAVLGRIFGFENSSSSRLRAKDDEPSSPESVDEEKEAEDELESPADVFVKDLMLLSKKLMTAVNGTSRTQQQKETLDTIEKAAKKYVKEKDEEAKAKAAKDTVDNGSEGSSTAKATPVSSADSITGKIDDDSTAEDKSKETESEAKSSGLFDETETKDRKSVHTSADGLNPDDIDIYEPEVIVDEKDLEEDAVPDLSVSESAGKVAEEKSDKSQTETVKLSKEDMEELTDFAAQLETQAERLRARSETVLQEFGDADDSHKLDTLLAELEASTSLIEKRLCQISQLKKLMHGSEKCTTDVTKKFEAGIDAQQKKTEAMSEYVRTTRGLALRSLAIYLIPIKASVLSKAFDLTVLRSITLLNVGLQTAFWNHLAKENKTSPLPLRKIHTDNVTMPFLTFVNQLETLTELFILERTTKSQEYSFAPKTSVTNNSIRRLVLKKHISSLKRLVIKNENDLSWDANERFLELLCRKGKNLEELAISFSSSAVVGVISVLCLPCLSCRFLAFM
jgi:arsenate reductase-like glutaredoxin family protein